jgi:hypothetical protein
VDVVERYLLTLRTYLPAGREDDLVAELRENIRAEVEDREERLGRPLTEEERVGLLRSHGHPFLVAGRYRSDGRRLVLGREVIGPALFPFFRISLLAVAAVTGLVLAFGAVASMAGIGRPIPYFRTTVFYLSLQVGIATLAFAAMEVWFRRTAQTWDPRRLPTPRASATPISLRIQALLQLVGTGIFLWIWIAVPDPLPFLGPALADLRAGPAWRLLYLGLLASTLLGLITPALTVLHPAWRRFRWVVTLFSSGAFIAFAGASLWNGAWVLPASARPDIDAVDLARGINSGFIFGLGLAVFVTGLATVFEVVRGAWREYRATPQG